MSLLILLIITLVYGSTEHYTTNNRAVYTSWYGCDDCQCQYLTFYAVESIKQNPSDPTPPVYIYGYHSSYNHCNNTYITNYFQNVNPVGLEISRSGRSAELIHNMTDYNITISLSWSTKDSDNINNCNCHDTYSYGTESTRINSKSNYRLADVTGYISINNIMYIPSATYSYISSYGQKVIINQHP